jgi:hypothetical protein
MRLDTLAARFVLTAALVGASGAPLGCADARGRFQQFEDRRAALDANAGRAGADGPSTGGALGAGGADGGCKPPAPGVVRGPALLALHTFTTSSAAILFFGEVETPPLGDATAVKYSYRALDAGDRRTQVGESLVVGPYAIASDGRFDAETAESTLPGEADAILPGVEITSQLTLHGTICGVSDFYCGTVTGTVTAPVMQEAVGEFGLLLVNSIDDIPAQPRFGCAEDALAPALLDAPE